MHDEDEARSRARFEALLALQRALASGLLEDVFPAFAARLAREIPFEAALVHALLDTEQVELFGLHRFEGAPPFEDDARLGARVSIEGTFVGDVLRSADVRSAGARFVERPRSVLASWASHSVVLPLVMHDAVVGVLVLFARAPISGDDERAARSLLASLAEPLAMAIRNASLVARLRTTTREWERTFDAMEAMIVVVDAQGKVRRANRAFAKRIGVAASTLVGRPFAAVFPGQTLPNTFQRHTTLAFPNGDAAHATASPIGDGSMVLVLHDVVRTSAQSATYPALRRIGSESYQRRGRVLVADDEPSILRAVTRTLGHQHDLTITTDGDEAIAAIRAAQGEFDAVVSDVQMLRVSGIDLYAAIARDFPPLADRVVFMTGGVFGGELEQFLRSLGPRVLRKPFDPDVLRRAVDERVALSSRVA